MFNNEEEILTAIQFQMAQEEKVRLQIEGLLMTEGYEDDDLPQNDNLGKEVRKLVESSKNVFKGLEQLELDYYEICGFKCFRVDDDKTGAEDLYCIPPTEVLVIQG